MRLLKLFHALSEALFQVLSVSSLFLVVSLSLSGFWAFLLQGNSL